MAPSPVTAAPRPLPHTGAVTGVLEALAFFRDPSFASRRFAQHGNVFATRLLGQQLVFVRGGRAVGALLEQPEALMSEDELYQALLDVMYATRPKGVL